MRHNVTLNGPVTSEHTRDLFHTHFWDTILQFLATAHRLALICHDSHHCPEQVRDVNIGTTNEEERGLETRSILSFRWVFFIFFLIPVTMFFLQTRSDTTAYGRRIVRGSIFSHKVALA